MFIKSRTHNDDFWESRNVPGVQLLTVQKKSREGWQHPPCPSSCPFLHSPPFPPVCRGEVSWDLLWAWLLVSPPGMMARMVPRGKSRTAEKQSLLMFVCLRKGVYGKMGAESLVYIPADG